LLSIIVLTMIAGARELMTPGAWRKDGFTYKLASEADQATFPSPDATRRQHLERLRTALWQFAAEHNGRFPTDAQALSIPSEQWEVPETSGMRYQNVQGLAAGKTAAPLVYEPELETDLRLVLKTNGAIVKMRTADIRAFRIWEELP